VPVGRKNMFCPKCGKEYLDSSKFCSSCGYNLDSSNTSASKEQPSSALQEDILSVKSKEKSLAVAGLLNIALIGAGYFYVGKYIWGTILLIAAVMAFIYSPEMLPALFILAIIGSIYAAYRYNKKILRDLLNSNNKKTT
jgi:hypothetical protein